MKFLYKIPGPILVTMGAFFLSYGGLLVKSFEGSDLWQILLYRSIFCFFTVGVFLFFTYKKETFNKFKVSGFVKSFFFVCKKKLLTNSKYLDFQDFSQAFLYH